MVGKDKRAVIETDVIVGVVIVLTIFGLIAAIALPVALDAITDDATVTITQDNQTTEDVNGALNATLDDVNGTDTNATYTLTQDDGTSIQKEINTTESRTFSFSRGDVVVTLDSITTGSPDQATATFAYNQEFAYSGGASALWLLLDVILVLGAFLFAVGIALKAMDR